MATVLIGKEVGRGAFGKVYEGNRNGWRVAVKIPIGGTLIEAELLPFKLRHENVIEILDFTKQGIIIMELCDFSLLHYYTKVVDHSRQDLHIMLGIAQGVSFLHDNKIVHRDLKPDNILLKGRYDCVVKVSDFTLAKEHEHQSLCTVVGNQRWLAPEFFDNDGKLPISKYTDSIDIFSMGKILLFIRADWNKRGDVNRAECK